MDLLQAIWRPTQGLDSNIAIAHSCGAGRYKNGFSTERSHAEVGDDGRLRKRSTFKSLGLYCRIKVEVRGRPGHTSKDVQQNKCCLKLARHKCYSLIRISLSESGRLRVLESKGNTSFWEVAYESYQLQRRAWGAMGFHYMAAVTGAGAARVKESLGCYLPQAILVVRLRREQE